MSQDDVEITLHQLAAFNRDVDAVVARASPDVDRAEALEAAGPSE